ncbi:hypothetical protein [Streptomyces ortus]|uniref:Uncharacterized protein n=1 Tax=Streptomyces ortus TaxID=2867268 RepID=A0ABT3UZ14_9ACTN|nr:hypothetical protein [Streptomyces ortus]MCX4232820.1 hypothetical protein [Streptomyces ortus]
MSNPDARSYGQYYWCIMLADKDQTEVYAHGDEVTLDDGVLVLWQHKDDKPSQQTLAFAPGQWASFYAASVLDGHAVSVEHWPGQITTSND